jgi:hypothetical protein
MAFNPTGGLIYHWRAARFAKTLWSPFRAALETWLSSWTPREKKLIVVGAGGGYMLPPAFLRRFDAVLAVDIDPVARLIFRRRFRSVGNSIQCDGRDYFRFPGISAEPFQDLLARQQEAAILFSNIWGQVGFLADHDVERDAMFRFWEKELPRLLAGRSWASYHDRYSGTDTATTDRPFLSGRRLAGEELIRRFCGGNTGGLWNDHLTGRLFPDTAAYAYFLWRLTRRSVHIVEGMNYPCTRHDVFG